MDEFDDIDLDALDGVDTGKPDAAGFGEGVFATHTENKKSHLRFA